MLARISLFVLTSALCCGEMGLYGQSTPPVDERTLLKQELELVKMERENLELRRELLKLQDSAQRGEAAIAHVAELTRKMQTLVAARDEAAAKAEQACANASGLAQRVDTLSEELKKVRKNFTEQAAGIDMLKADVAREREVAEVAMKKLADEQKSHLATRQACKTAQELQGQEAKTLQEELAQKSGQIEVLEADVAKYLREVKNQESTVARQAQRIQSLEAEVERLLQTAKTLEEACATERQAKASLEAKIAQLTAAREHNGPEEKVEAKVETKVEELPSPRDESAENNLKSILDELSPDRMFLKAPTEPGGADKPQAY